MGDNKYLQKCMFVRVCKWGKRTDQTNNKVSVAKVAPASEEFRLVNFSLWLQQCRTTGNNKHQFMNSNRNISWLFTFSLFDQSPKEFQFDWNDDEILMRTMTISCHGKVYFWTYKFSIIMKWWLTNVWRWTPITNWVTYRYRTSRALSCLSTDFAIMFCRSLLNSDSAWLYSSGLTLLYVLAMKLFSGFTKSTSHVRFNGTARESYQH